MISVIIPVKSSEFLDQAMQSVVGDNEVIVVDDSEGRGAAWARNEGLKQATGKYVAFCDADDYYEPHAFKVLEDAMTGVDMVVGSFRKFGAFESIVAHPTREFNRDEVARYTLSNLREPRRNQMLSGCWAKLYRRELLGKFPDLVTAEDMAFNFDYLTRCDLVRFVGDVVYNNRKQPNSLSTTFDPLNPKGLFGVFDALTVVRRFLSEFYPDSEIEPALDNSRIYHAMLYFVRICEQEQAPMNEVFKRLFP